MYAKIVVPINAFPDFFPRVAIPGTMKAIIIKGITNDKKFPNRELNVERTLMGKVISICLQASPKIIPKIKAKNIRLINEKLFINILL
ncbi:hypothetical protein CNEO4_80009 [Clostridium neonatale]|uniref:Uncharacterized protein n=1 Tax=Clostridium neonatale TaxID=137838 RepID=A0AA86MDP6_9CLOT|nr:hypothetical protein CNEO_130103 [Clostridium neonatale]CAG9703070.1 hypothetical protein CNEO_40325 [Clostridium neonatale]CAI3212706.1 hypothetical protein CNEO2_630008 [Clostridium neonatale]CAI3213426.1 hypothetical protein CNEO2_640008 [Clostridium neonatale]CAI3244510.1 hypothetical protein CNEO2_530009 [Clostridium neonatale]